MSDATEAKTMSRRRKKKTTSDEDSTAHEHLYRNLCELLEQKDEKEKINREELAKQINDLSAPRANTVYQLIRVHNKLHPKNTTGSTSASSSTGRSNQKTQYPYGMEQREEGIELNLSKVPGKLLHIIYIYLQRINATDDEDIREIEKQSDDEDGSDDERNSSSSPDQAEEDEEKKTKESVDDDVKKDKKKKGSKRGGKGKSKKRGTKGKKKG